MRILTYLVTLTTGMLIFTGLKLSSAFRLVYTEDNNLENHLNSTAMTEKQANLSRSKNFIYEKKYFDVIETTDSPSYGPFTEKEEEVIRININDYIKERTKRSVVIQENIDKTDTIDIFLKWVHPFSFNIVDFVNIKHFDGVVDVNSWIEFIIERANLIINLPGEKSIERTILGSLDYIKGDKSCKVEKLAEYLKSNVEKYHLEPNHIGNKTNCAQNHHIINTKNIICNTDKFFNVFFKKLLFGDSMNLKYIETDELTRYISAVIEMLYEEINYNRRLRRYLLKKKYKKVKTVINILYETIKNVDFLEYLYKNRGYVKEDNNKSSENAAVRFYDYFFINEDHKDAAYEIEEVVRILSHLEKRRLIFDIGDAEISLYGQKMSVYLHIILSFVASFKN
ncbi:hypothetical protein NGRA_1833 [Nosema granulosis]|uniref:Uncharacterized protein n=1 Tax=Nosema granulosis TaxID=83296 RepID=A0A9P6GYN6_9MICR|nr:hypothetical protein NGRA_1833 [Nosema granulosis]